MLGYYFNYAEQLNYAVQFQACWKCLKKSMFVYAQFHSMMIQPTVMDFDYLALLFITKKGEGGNTSKHIKNRMINPVQKSGIYNLENIINFQINAVTKF